MNSFKKDFLITAIALATISRVVPSTAWSKGAPNGGGGNGGHFSHGPSILKTLSKPVQFANNNSNVTLSSSSGSPIAPTIHNNSNSPGADWKR
jgi:hypothetical protein